MVCKICGKNSCTESFHSIEEQEDKMDIEEIQSNRAVDLLAEHKKMKATLEHIIEYWNRDENPAAMSDALWHIINECEIALKE